MKTEREGFDPVENRKFQQNHQLRHKHLLLTDLRSSGWARSNPVEPGPGGANPGQIRDNHSPVLTTSSPPAAPPIPAPTAPQRVPTPTSAPARRGRRSGKRGCIYARYSSRYQHSIEDQVRACRQWAEANGIDVADCHIFIDEGQTGRSHRRQGFKDMVKALEAGEIDVVIAFATSRLFRKLYRTLMFVEEEIVDRRLRCVFVKSGIDTNNAEHWRYLLQTYGMVDEIAIQMQAHHVRAAHEGQLRMGVIFGTVTYGFTGEPLPGQLTKLGKPLRRLIIDEVTSKLVKQIFEWFVNEEVSISEIVRRLNAQSAPLPERNQSGRWTYLVVRRILDNDRYIGRWSYGEKQAIWQNKAGYSRQFKRDEPICTMDFPHLRIIDDNTWARAQELLQEYRRRAGRRRKDGKKSIPGC